MKIQSKLMLTAAALAALTAASSGVASARGISFSGSVSVRVGAGRTPSPRVEQPTRRPYRGAVWVQGYWAMQRDRSYLWVPGRWERPRPPVATTPSPYVPPPPGTVYTPPRVAVPPQPVYSYPAPRGPRQWEEYRGNARRPTAEVKASIAAGLPSKLPDTQQPIVFIWTDAGGVFHVMATSRAQETIFQGRISSGRGITLARTIGDNSTDRVRIRENAIVFDLRTQGADGFEFTPGEGSCVHIDLRDDVNGTIPTIMMGVNNVVAPTGNLKVCR